MNNNILKSLRQAMLSTAAAAVVSIGFMACSNETFMTQKAAAPADGYQVCIPANIGSGDTRAISYNSETGGYDATFETTDEIGAFHISRNGFCSKCLKPDGNGKTANLVGKLYFGETAPSVGDELLLFYKNDAPYLNYSHDFTSDNSDIEYAVAKVKIESINGDQMTLSAATFYNPQSLFKINFTGINSDVKIKKMTIASEQGKLVNQYEPSRSDRQDFFSNVVYTYKDGGTAQRELIFMLRFGIDPYRQPSEPGDVITFNALGSDGHTYIGTRTVTNDLENGKYYHADVAMTDMGLAMTLTNNTTGESVEINDWTQIQSKDAAYTLKNTGYNASFGWFGGNNTLTLNGVTINNSNRDFLHVQTDSNDPDNTKDHYLVLDGENTMNISSSNNAPPALSVSENSTLTISAASSGGKLAINNAQGINIHMSDNAKIVLESGELIFNGWIGYNNTSSFVITNKGKLRCKNEESIVKAGSGFILNTAKEGDYTVYTVTAADPYENPKTLSSATTDDIGKIIGSDGNIHVPNWDLPAGVSPVAMIANISSNGHGLALALDKVKVRHDIDHGWYYDESFTWNSAGENNKGKTTTEIFDDWKANNNVTFGTWRFATAADWQQMVFSCRIDGDATEVGDDMVAEGLVAILKQAGLFRDSFECWTGEFDTEGRITAAMLDNWYWDPENPEGYRGPYKLRFNYTDAEYINERYSNILPALEF